MEPSHRTCVLVLGAGAGWESTALKALSDNRGVVVLKRCVDVTDLLAAVTMGQAHVAVLALDAPGLDSAAIDHLRLHQVEPVVVLADAGREDLRARVHRLGVTHCADESHLSALADLVVTAAREPGALTRPAGGDHPGRDAPGTVGPGAAELSEGVGPMMGPGRGRSVVVWGPTGGPGRTTVALGLAGEMARRGAAPLVLDVDPWGGSVGQHLGVLEEVSGLLACARAHVAGDLHGSYLQLQRRVAGLRVVTGLPRADRWVEIRAGAVEELIALGKRQGEVVVDTGFALEPDPAAEHAGRAGRNSMTLEALGVADELVVVGAADPVGLARLARGLVELREVTGDRAVHVVVNRMRGSLGWSEKDVAAMVSGFADIASLYFLPDDRAAADRALVAGRTLAETGDSPLARALAQVVDALHPTSARARKGLLRGRNR
ncbi:MinD-like ATPase involved in chromosome partitioning or flagellar assembly [Nocardioides daedukensis]|uniref:MinD-like ATPase involved in chromosome partitioning or flagellar assembly n=1 Tax=Nocardioides daedukensis TaxID=634462 RepID=A0A7Y9S1T3_9ACTN|nr:hypothetical protein [Nocardioides daedukensis]NYG60325.1 MinD-like ATPase involved in chromosome partitioning or flagellar assembly [Nocardioides daedukensis]